MSADYSFDMHCRQIEVLISEYVQEIGAYAAFMADWRERNDPAARRVRRFREAAEKRENAA